MKPVPVSVGNMAAGALIIGATFVSYRPALSGDFIWNDSDYVTAPGLRSLGGLARIWTKLGATEQYYPLLHSAFWVQHRLWGDHPLGYHIVTVLLHAASALLFALILRRLLIGDRAQSVPAPAGTDRSARDPGAQVPRLAGPRTWVGAAWLAALLFALHPVHVESVAWITEQKNTLSLVFYLAAALLYLRFDETRRPRTYGAALVLFVASLGCKTVTATLPAALLVIFWWQRGRLAWRRDVLPLLPWLAAGAAAGLFSSWVEWTYGGAHGADFQLSLLGRALVAGRAICFYAGKLVWPSGLNFIYPRWTIDAGVWWQWLFPLGVLAVGAGLWALRRRTRGPLAAFLFFVGSLFPVLGFVNLYGARFSWVWDHWQYLPDLGPLALVAAGLTAACRGVALRLQWLGPGLFAALAVGLGALTWSHCRMFHDDQTLYRTTLARNPGCWMAHYNLGVIWSHLPGRLMDAAAEFEETLRLRPDSAEAHNNLGDVWLKTRGRLDDAIAQYQAVVRLTPDSYRGHYNLGVALAHVPGRLSDAIAQYEEAVRLQPDFAAGHDNLGVALAHVPGRLSDAIAQFEEAVRLQPDFAGAHNNLGLALSQVPGRLNDAIAHYREALRLQPDFEPGWYNLGASWYQLGNMPEAVAAFREALRLAPDDPAARQALAAALQRTEGR
ncbi:MAG TPA: tetratricopeptide repeat protein [Opitutaceae bacterium]|nr:tetratricopeptide repeat protein [Opitutaceae bacterium]